MPDFEAMAAFVQVVQQQSFTRAARTLGVSKSSLSMRLARLEERLGARLLERSTRSLRPTPAGAAYYERCVKLVAEAEAADTAVRDLGASPRGLLRVASPQLFGETVVARVAAEFQLEHPDVDIEVVTTERVVHLVEEGFDLAIRMNRGEDEAGLRRRTLKAGERRCMASPRYLALRGTPEHPEALATHACVLFGGTRHDTWHFARGETTRAVRVSGHLALTSLSMVREAVLAGAGIGDLPLFFCRDDVRAGRLVPLLDGWDGLHADIRVVYTGGRLLSPRVRLFVDKLVAACATMRTARPVLVSSS